MTALDLVIRGATVVTAERREAADIGIAGGRIAQLGGTMTGQREIRASGLFALPGGVDPHVHLTNDLPTPTPGDVAWVDDFESGSEAALTGGITTVGNMTFASHGATMSAAVGAARALVSRQATADVFLHPVMAPAYPGAIDELPGLLAEGHRSLKLFMSTPDFDREIDRYREAMRVAARLDTPVLIHCEDAGVIHRCTAELVARGCGLQHFAESRPPVAEVTAVRRAIALAAETGARIYIVHLSCGEALAACEEARGRGLPVYVEARPLYLHLTSERYRSPRAGLFVGQPPLRERADVEALWAGVRSGAVDTLGSDHAPWTEAQKLDPGHTLQEPRPGVADLETMLPLLLSTAVHERSIPLERLVALTAANPARLFGLYPRKGTIAAGSDADVVLWDLGVSRAIQGATLRSRARYSPYEGMIASAWPRITIRRGEVVFSDGELFTRPGSGQTLPRSLPLPPV
jgi:dihydropyrimidinase